MKPLTQLAEGIVECRQCPRLVRCREQAARAPRAAYTGQRYWARPLPGFGDPVARLLVLGLAPAAHGGNRTGRVFTGDRSADWLYRAMHRAGFANQPTSVARDDGLALRDAWVTVAVRCAPPDNKPSPAERDRCLPFLVREVALLPRLRGIVALGSFAWDAALRVLPTVGVKPRPKFGHLAEVAVGPYRLVGSYHPSQQNTFTGRLTEPMLDAVFERARALIDEVDGGAPDGSAGWGGGALPRGALSIRTRPR